MALPTAPTTNVTNIGSVPSKYFDKVAIKAINATLSLYGALDFKNMPLNSGSVMQIYANMGADPATVITTPATEGVMGAGTVFQQPVKSLTLSQYVDYFTFSDKLVQTGLPALLEDASDTLGKRGALVVDTIIAAALDTAATADATANIDIPDGVYFTAAKSRTAGATLGKKNIEYRANGKFFGVLPTAMKFDLTNDATAGGFIDLSKYNESTVKVLQDGISAGKLVGVIDGVEWYESNGLPTEANFLTTGKTGYHSYVVGSGALWAATLGTNALGQKNFAVNVDRYSNGNPIDVARQTAASCWYKFMFGLTTRPGTTNAFVRVRSESSLG